jgi:hypothetical protein
MAERSEHVVNCTLVTNWGKLERKRGSGKLLLTFSAVVVLRPSNLILSLNRVSDMK